ncbi:MAG: 50S ribosomal protein L17 [SAR202 cluster bacterium]|nr:50S ribosomal protein L17 [SAR202 cluster bacterium]
MRHEIGGRKLGRRTAHREALLQNLVAELIDHERITTTEAKAKELRRVAERMITTAKSPTLAHRRAAMSELTNKDAVRKLFEELGPRFAERNGGYTRIVKLMPRQGDAAPMALVELV